MGKLGIAIYPERSTFEQDAAYLKAAHELGYRRVFTSLLQIKGNQEGVLASFKKVIAEAKRLEFEVMVDINPALFEQLAISYDDLSFFVDLGADGIRLDLGFTGAEEARMTRNPYGLQIEINMSQGTSYVDNIMSYSPERAYLLGSHNFYPHRYTGLSLEHFTACTQQFKQYGLNTMAFVHAPSATFGPWPTQDGLCTLEEHRVLPIATQVKHLRWLETIDDLTIGDAYASQEDLRAAADAFFAPYPALRVEVAADLSPAEKAVIFEPVHMYRGDRSAYLLRSTQTRVTYQAEAFPAKHTHPIKAGDLLIDNEHYGQYKGELQIALKDMENDGRVNVVGRIAPEEQFLLPYLKPWAAFKLVNGAEK